MTEDKKKQAVDIGIITIKPEEYTAVIHRLGKREQIDTGKHLYACQSIKTADGRSLGVAVARSLDQGNSAAQALASDMIAELSPKCLLLAGIAGGVPASEYSLGDVLLCTRLYDFSVCCSLEDQPSEFDVKSIPVHSHARKILEVLPGYAEQLNDCEWNSEQTLGMSRPVVDLTAENGTKKIYGDEDWKKEVRESLEQNFSRPRKPKFHLGSTGSSDRLIKSPSLIQQWKPLARGLTHVEMELAGVYKAASESQTPVLAIRGLSDIVGYKRSPEWTHYACETAASFAIALIRTGLLLPSGATASSATDPSVECPQVPKSEPLADTIHLADIPEHLTPMLKKRTEKSPQRRPILGSPKVQKARTKYLEIFEADVLDRLKTSIHNARFIDIGADEDPSATYLPWQYRADDRPCDFSRFEDAFHAYHGRVLLLGAPGSGKTTTLLHLAKQLIEQAKTDPDAPIPLLVNLSQFRFQEMTPLRHANTLPFRHSGTQVPDTSNCPIEAWLIQIFAGYPRVTSNIIQNWLAEERVAILLDGLDETEERYLLEFAGYLNLFIDRYPDMITVVCSRIVEYRPLRAEKNTRLHLHGAVTLQPLTHPQINEYLEKAQATALRNALPHDNALYELAQTPLTLSMMTLAYAGLAPTDLPRDLSLIERRRHLFDTYVTRMLQRKARHDANEPFDLNPDNDLSIEYSEKQVNHWLGWLAVRMSERAHTVFPLDRFYNFFTQVDKDKQDPAYWLVVNLTDMLVVFIFMLLVGVGLMPWTWKGAGIVLGISFLGAMIFSDSSRGKTDNGNTEDETEHAKTKNIFSFALLASMCPYLLITDFLATIDFFSTGTDTVSGTVIPISWLIIAGISAVTMLFVIEKSILIEEKIKLIAVMCVATAMPIITQWLFGSMSIWEYPAAISMSLAFFVFFTRKNLAFFIFSTRKKGDGLFSISHNNWSETVFLILFWIPLLIGGSLLASFVVFMLSLGTLFAASNSLGMPDWYVVFSLISLAILKLFINNVSLRILTGLLLGSWMGYWLAGNSGSLFMSTLLGTTAWVLWEKNETVKTHIDVLIERYIVNQVLNLILKVRREVPWFFKRFLNTMRNTLLLKSVSTNHEFVHRLLRDHFAIRELIPQLGTGDMQNRTRSIQRLALQGESSIDTLAALLHDSHAQIREAAVIGLTKTGMPAIVPILIDILQGDDMVVAKTGVIHLQTQKFTDEETQRLFTLALYHESARVRLAAVWRFKKKFKEEVSEVIESFSLADLRAALTDSHWQIREQAVDILKASCSLEVLADLHEACLDKDEDVRYSAVLGASYIADTSNLPFLKQILLGKHPCPIFNGKKREGKDRIGFIKAIRTLGDIGGTTAVSCLQKVLDEMLDDKINSYKTEVVSALGKIGSVSAVFALQQGALKSKGDKVFLETLEKIMRNVKGSFVSASFEHILMTSWNADDRKFSASILGRIGNASAIPALQNALLDTRPSVRKAIVYALGNIGDVSAMPALQHALRDIVPSVRVAAARALDEIGDTSCIPTLQQALQQELQQELQRSIPSIRVIVAWALGEFGNTWALGEIGDTSCIPVLQQALQSRVPSMRVEAAWALGKIGDTSCIPVLQQALQSRVPSVRVAAARTLGKFGDISCIPALQQALQSHVPSVRIAAAGALEKIGDTSYIPALQQALQSHVPSMRVEAARALGKIGDTSCIPALQQALQSRMPSVRAETVRALGKIGDTSCMPLLEQALQDKAYNVRYAAIETLCNISDESVVPSLQRALQDKDRQVCEIAAHALGRIDTISAISALQQALRDKRGNIYYVSIGLQQIRNSAAIPILQEFLQDKNSTLHRAVVRALGKIGAVSGIPLLAQTLQDNKQAIRKEAVGALARIGGHSSALLLHQFLENRENKEVCQLAVDVLGEIGDTSSISILQQILRDEDPKLRIAAAKALRRIGDDSIVIPVLRQILRDNHPELRAYAAETLGKAEDASIIPDLKWALENKEWRVCLAAADALRTIGTAEALVLLNKWRQKQGEEEKMVRVQGC